MGMLQSEDVMCVVSRVISEFIGIEKGRCELCRKGKETVPYDDSLVTFSKCRLLNEHDWNGRLCLKMSKYGYAPGCLNRVAFCHVDKEKCKGRKIGFYEVNGGSMGETSVWTLLCSKAAKACELRYGTLRLENLEEDSTKKMLVHTRKSLKNAIVKGIRRQLKFLKRKRENSLGGKRAKKIKYKEGM